MSSVTWQKIVHDYQIGNYRSYDRLVQELYKNHHRILLKLTRSEDDAWIVYAESMIKFREKFLLDGAALPDNPEGYIYQIQKNVWIDLCRKRNKKSQLQYAPVEVSQLANLLKVNMASGNQSDALYNSQNKEQHHLIALEKAIGKMCEKCREIIERNIFEGLKLKVLKIEMNYGGSYQAIVEKKKRCIKKLAKLFFLELNQI